MTVSCPKVRPRAWSFVWRLRSTVSRDFPLGNLKQLRWFRTDKRGLLGGVVKTLFGLPKDYSSLLPISQKSTHGYLPPEDTSGHQQQLQELCLASVSPYRHNQWHIIIISPYHAKLLRQGLTCLSVCVMSHTHTCIDDPVWWQESGDPGYMTQPLKAALQYFHCSSLWVTPSLPYL